MKHLIVLPFLLFCNLAAAFPFPDECNPRLPSCQPEDTDVPVIRVFKRPVIAGGRLDWCRNWATECGAPAAQSFCELKGFTSVRSFSIDNDVGYTKLLNGQICSESYCDGFEQITCIGG